MQGKLAGLSLMVGLGCTASLGAAPADGGPPLPTPSGEACAHPNPLRGTTDDLQELIETVVDGGLEAAVPWVDPPTGGASIERRADAAHTGSYGFRVQSTSSATVEMDAHIDKGDVNVFSVWVRSRSGSAKLRLTLRTGETNDAVATNTWKETLGDVTDVGEAWTQLTLTYSTTQNMKYARVGVRVPEGAVIDVDDFSAKAPWFKYATYADGGRTVGAIAVPQRPVAPTHFAVLIHIEDGSLLVPGTQYFAQKTAVFEAIAKILKSHSGFLTIQPEREWALGANALAAHDGSKNVLARLADDYGVRYSTHTHGPACVEANGTTHNGEECKGHPEWASNPITPEAVGAYAKERKAIFEAASGTKVTDHNGNFDAADWGPLVASGFTTMSGYKDGSTQRMMREVFNNPWRPSNVNGITNPTGFETHNAKGSIIFVPGVGQSVPKYHASVPEYASRALSQYLSWASSDRVNTFYIILHVDNYASRTGLSADKYVGSDEFNHDVGVLDTLMTNTIDPLVAAGYVKWSSLEEMGRAFTHWEQACAAK